MKKLNLLFIGTLAFVLQNVSAQAQLLESWENDLDGWTLQQPYTPSFVTTPGVTDGIYSLALTGTASPSYGQMLRSAFSSSFTTALGNATSLSFDVYTPSGSFGNFLQFDVDVNNTDTGFVSLDGFSYPSTVIGAETTITVPVSASLSSILAASVNPTQIIIQIGGGSSGNPQTMYLDNVRVTPAPEPGTMTLFGLGALGLLGFVRRCRS
jgi:hypothetical protein